MIKSNQLTNYIKAVSWIKLFGFALQCCEGKFPALLHTRSRKDSYLMGLGHRSCAKDQSQK